MTEWRVYLNGSEENLSVLAKESDAEWSVRRDAERFYLTHIGWTKLAAGTEARNFAEVLLDRINLVKSFLTTPTASWEPVWFGEIQFVNDLNEMICCQISIDWGVPIGWGGTPNNPMFSPNNPMFSEELPPVAQWVRAMAENHDLVDAMRILRDHGNNWTQICNVIELVESAHNGAIPSAWASATRLKRLKHTANCRSTAGDTARHMSGQGKPPKHPMGLLEARAITQSIILRWVKGMG